uniref:Major facilitator superfamily (MFS) profile domain-containing protein n=1 Tax=Minutocellus polymorphus TaxID=265543 RepID=A0A7S0FQH8_9STRA|mmetsp:Transcript_5565/g.9448  ORF Transcript_5565/g.9448 Transcript_5565/m.9448 type:complete len:163 (+) Transcript_5565:1-489(+)
MAPWAVASVLMVAVGLLSDRIFAKTSNIRKSQIYVIAACQLLSSICFLPLLFTGESNGTAATICVTLGVGIGLANNAPYFTFCNMRFPSYAAQATGTMIWFFTVGFTCAPFITGYIMDHTSSFSGAFAVVIALLLSAVLVLMLFAFPDKEEVHIITRGTNKL